MSVKLRWKKLSSGKQSAYLDLYMDGTRSYEFLKIYLEKRDPNRTQIKRLAESIRAKREIELQANAYDFVPSFKKNADFLKFFQTYLDAYNKKDERKVAGAYEKFKEFIHNDTLPIKKLSPKICEDFRDYLQSNDSGLSGETPYDYWKKFKGVLNRAVKEKIITANPCSEITFRGNQKHNYQLKKEVLTTEELQKLAKARCGNTEVKKAFLTACYSGLGYAEAKKLTWDRIKNGKIKLYRSKSGEQIINDLPEFILRMLGVPGSKESLVFNLPSDTAVTKNLKNWLKTAKIDKKITFYCARHTFATQLLLNGANLKTVADCMGHSSTKYTLKYLNYVDELKTEAINRLPKLEF